MVSSIVNRNTTSDVIWSFAPKTELRTLFCEISIERQYIPVNRNEYINALKMTITDKLGRLVDLNGENVEYVLDLKKS